MNLIFFGSAPFSTIVLQKLIDYSLSTSRFALSAVVTTPDKPVGRHLTLTPNPVKLLAQKHGLPVIEKLSELIVILNEVKNPVGLVAAYGKILKSEILSKFDGHLYNIHPSLLPKYRGPSPLQNQILDGVTETGVTIIQLDEQMDHGPIVAQQKDQILDSDTFQSLGTRLFELGADLFTNVILPAKRMNEIHDGGGGSRLDSSATPQNDSLATYTHMLTRESGFVPYDQFKPELLDKKFRAYYPWPGVWTTTPEGKRLKLVALKPQILVQLEGKSPAPLADIERIV